MYLFLVVTMTCSGGLQSVVLPPGGAIFVASVRVIEALPICIVPRVFVFIALKSRQVAICSGPG
jgi:hypothetical protein